MPRLSADAVELAADLLRRGGVVAMPTETVYGLAADAMNRAAVARVFDLKGRPRFDPLIVHAQTTEAALAWAARVPDAARQLAAACWPGPLTLVLPKVAAVDELVTAGLDTVALRVPGHALARRLIAAVGSPLAAPSANRFGGVSPTEAAHVVAEFGDAVPVLDGGACERGVESTVVACDEAGGVRVLRLGSLTVEAIERVLGRSVAVQASTDRPAGSGLEGPGMLSRHYAPRTPVALVEHWKGEAQAGALALNDRPAGYAAVERLSATADLVEAAANLFAAMRRLDARGLARIDARLLPERDLGRAINDRLRRAATDRGSV